ncbi:cytochrome-c peroxidase [Hymenobacter psychrotolerans]|uniref:Cytochrome c peroxidase n=1 Tax=Hymenobacter psychrotolerans DSM 18569 TaxID=1121959 RepID=A0A1M6VV25_9BACT|nr:cytochrome c peroxidase [Hymenobacter psychrotolerans]SHK85176.1 cytochrome c peroxidase [Hymenobacter psychrotolerans DSM 18569]
MKGLFPFLHGWLLLALLAAGGCRPDADVRPLEEVPGISVPANFPPPVYGVEKNPPTRAAFELGRTLFYDPRLSRTGDVSCGSCHQQFVAFAHASHQLSHGVENRLGTRNAPALQNLRWKPTFFWDGGASHIETMPLAPITNPVEMDETIDNVVRKLNADREYQRRFAAVFGGSGPIDSYQFLRALAQFTAALTSANSRYDKYARHEAGGTLDAAEQRGLQVLRQKCGSCHAGELFTDESFRNNGLDRRFPLDSGRAHITSRGIDVGRFKVPSLRNVALTAPYMHDGRFQTLGEVLDHYTQGMVASPTLDPQFRQPNGRLGIPLTPEERQDLLSFLATLTDEEFLRNPQLAEQ